MDFVDEFYADKDLSLLNKLTLVIPTYNRNYYLSRCLWYHAHFPFGEIIVADSSPEEKKSMNREIVQKIRARFGANVRYLEYESIEEKFGGHILKKWADAMQHVKTQYVINCTDKEFLIPTTITSLITFLDDNEDYVAASGKKYRIVGNMNDNVRTSSYYMQQIWQDRSSETMDNGLDRFLDSLGKKGDSNTLLFSVIRTDVQKYVYDLLSKYNIWDLIYGEILTAYTHYLIGKSWYDPDQALSFRDVIFLQRDVAKRKTKYCKSIESSCSRYNYRIYDYKKSTESSDFDDRYKQCIRDQLIKFINMDNDDADLAVTTKVFQTQKLYPNHNRPIVRLFISVWNDNLSGHYIWKNLPFCLKKTIQRICSVLFGMTMNVERKRCVNMMDHKSTSIIAMLIMATTDKHHDDLPIDVAGCDPS
jgi:glycosyltransferase domain-containing protein